MNKRLIEKQTNLKVILVTNLGVCLLDCEQKAEKGSGKLKKLLIERPVLSSLVSSSSKGHSHKCNQCENDFKCENGLKIHIGKAQKKIFGFLLE